MLGDDSFLLEKFFGSFKKPLALAIRLLLRFGVWLVQKFPKLASIARGELLRQADSLSAYLSPQIANQLTWAGSDLERSICWDKASLPNVPTKSSLKNGRQPKVSFIVPSFNGSYHLRNLFASFLEHNTYANYEFVVVTQGSRDETAEIISFYSAYLELVEVDNSTNESFSLASNRGAKAATGEILIFCNNDVEFPSDLLGNFIRNFDRTRAAIIGVRQASRNPLTGSENVWHVGITFDWDPLQNMLKPSNIPDPQNLAPEDSLLRTWAVNGGFFGIRAKDFWELDGFSLEYDFGYEDIDLCLRSWRDLGRDVVVDTGTFLYHHESSTRNSVEKPLTSKRRIQNSEALARKFHSFIGAHFMANRFFQLDSKLDYNPVISFFVTSNPEDSAGHGDSLVAGSLGKWLKSSFGWDVRWVPQTRWYDEKNASDVNLVMRPDTDLRKILSTPYSLTISWIRNRLNEWIMKEELHLSDIYLVSSNEGKRVFEQKTRFSAEVLRIAVDPELFPVVDPKVSRPTDVLLTENYWGARRDFHDWNPSHNELNVVVLGKGWEGIGAPGRLSRFWKGFRDYQQLGFEYSRSKLVIDDATEHTRTWGLLNMRVYEASLSGCLVLSNDKAGIHEIFGEEFPFWTESADLDSLVQLFAQGNDDVVARVAKAQEIVLQNHTYKHRAEQLGTILRGAVGRKKLRIMLPVPSAAERESWGDWHIAKYLGFQMSKLGYEVRYSFLREWGDSRIQAAPAETRLVIRGLSRYTPRAEDLNLMWLMSHPDKVDFSEVCEYDLALIASRDLLRELGERGLSPFLFEQFTDYDLFHSPVDTARSGLVYVANTRGVRRTLPALAKAAKIPVAVFGFGWKESDFAPGSRVSDGIPNSQLPEVYSSHAACLSDAWPSMNEAGIISNRVFDAAASGALVVMEKISGDHPLLDYIMTYGSADDLEKIVSQLGDPALEEKARKLQTLVADKYNSVVRAKELHLLLQELNIKT